MGIRWVEEPRLAFSCTNPLHHYRLTRHAQFINNTATLAGDDCGGAIWLEDPDSSELYVIDCGDMKAGGNNCAGVPNDINAGTKSGGFTNFEKCVGTCAVTELPDQCPCGGPGPGTCDPVVFVQPSTTTLSMTAGFTKTLRYKVTNPNNYPFQGQTLAVSTADDMTVLASSMGR